MDSKSIRRLSFASLNIGGCWLSVHCFSYRAPRPRFARPRRRKLIGFLMAPQKLESTRSGCQSVWRRSTSPSRRAWIKVHLPGEYMGHINRKPGIHRFPVSAVLAGFGMDSWRDCSFLTCESSLNQSLDNYKSL